MSHWNGVNLRTGYNKEHLTNVASYQKFCPCCRRYCSFVFIGRRNVLLSFSPKRNDRGICCLWRTEASNLARTSSEVWLNAGSSIYNPGDFCQRINVRSFSTVKLISLSKKIPQVLFIVEASQLSVKVLGTRFNVKAYPNDEKITTTLTSGKVEVSVQSQPPHILKPNEQLHTTKNHQTSIYQ